MESWCTDIPKKKTKEIGETGVFVKSKKRQPSDAPHFIYYHGNRKHESIKKLFS
jgi:hypothetical protein